jgi:hypothetical protein
MATKCFPFNNPGPCCFTDATARELTDTKHAPDPQRAREQREEVRAAVSLLRQLARLF